jgi:hypothetical protein
MHASAARVEKSAQICGPTAVEAKRIEPGRGNAYARVAYVSACDRPQLYVLSVVSS